MIAALAAGTLTGAVLVVAVEIDPSDAVVPDPTATTSVINVSVGSDREPDRRAPASPLAGVQLGLFDGPDDEAPVPGFGTCTSDGEGDCSFVVPDTEVGGQNRDRRFWVKALAAPDGYDLIDTFQVGLQFPLPYRFQTGPALIAGREYYSGADFMVDSDRADRPVDSGGVWQVARENPSPPQPACDLRLAFVVDVSGEQGVDLDESKIALTRIVGQVRDQGADTGATASLYTFAEFGPADDSANQTRLDVPLGFGSPILSYIDGLNPVSRQSSNWDAGIAQVLSAPEPYDVVVVITGNGPTGVGPGVGEPGVVRLVNLEFAVFSANAVKAAGTRIVAWNLAADRRTTDVRAITGPDIGSDYYLDDARRGTLPRDVGSLARETCRKPITVQKLLIPAGGKIADATPGSGYGFDATTTGSVTASPPSLGTGPDGTGELGVLFERDSEGTVTLTEKQRPGHTLVQVDGANATCVESASRTPVKAANSGPLGFTLAVADQTAVTCTVYNQAPPPSTVTVNKTWIVNGTTYPDGSQPAGLTATATLDGTPQPFGVPREGVDPGILLTLDETVDLTALPLCTLASSRLTQRNGAPDDAPLPQRVSVPLGDSTNSITNTVTCTSELTLGKTVANDNGGTAQPDDWRLTATPPAGATPVSVLGGNTAASPVAPGTAYVLGESGPAGYTAGAWECKTAGGETVTLANGNTLTPAIGASITCTITNTDQQALLTLRKEVAVGDSGSVRTPGDWGLTAAPADGGPAVGGNGLNGVTAFPLDAGRYALSEAGPPGFTPGTWTCTGAVVTGSEVALTSGADVTCTITNTAITPTLTLRKTVDNGETGGTAVDTDWTLTAENGASEITGVSGSPDVTGVATPIGEYTLDESDGPDGYSAAAWTCTGASAATAATVTLAEGESAVCTITNTAISPRLTLAAAVTGPASPSEWTLTATSNPTISGPSGSPQVTDVAVPVGTWALSVTGGPSGYDAGGWTCTGGSSSTGESVTLALADAATCTVAMIAAAPPGPPAPPSPPGPPASGSSSGRGSLPATGADPVPPIGAAVALLMAGGLLVALDRRRRSVP